MQSIFPNHKSVFLILKPECYSELLSWTGSKEDEPLTAMVVAYLEAGFKHSIPVDCIDQAIFPVRPSMDRRETVVVFIKDVFGFRNKNQTNFVTSCVKVNNLADASQRPPSRSRHFREKENGV
jgi:hypothetical protein